MNREQQNLFWACLPKEARSELRAAFNMPSKYGYSDSVRRLLTYIYGCNLTSDTEPEELLLTPIKRAQQLYQEYKNLITPTTGAVDKAAYGGVLLALQELFGDKCLPDKELEHRLEQPSVQDEPKFKVGDKVRKTRWDKDTTISMVEWHGTWKTFVYHFKEQEYGFNCHKENDLTLVSKRAKDPDFSIGDKVQLKIDWFRLLKGTLLTIKDIPTIDIGDTFMYSFEETDKYIRETMLEPYTEEDKEIDEALYGKDMVSPKDEEEIEEMVNREAKEKETMEEKELGKEDNFTTKELNLAELLKGCEGEELYSLISGNVTFEGVEILEFDCGLKPILCTGGNFNTDGTYLDGGICCLYPSRALYEKYPLDAKKAWDEWASDRKSKRWTPQIGERIFWVNANLTVSQDRFNDFETQRKRRAVGNEFKTGKEAEQAAEAMREALQKFHEKNSAK